MKKTKAIKRKNLPAKLPVTSTVIMLIAVDYWQAPEWLKGILYFIYALIWITAIYVMFFSTEYVDVLNDD
jgi:hypothetical protein